MKVVIKEIIFLNENAYDRVRKVKVKYNTVEYIDEEEYVDEEELTFYFIEGEMTVDGKNSEWRSAVIKEVGKILKEFANGKNNNVLYLD